MSSTLLLPYGSWDTTAPIFEFDAELKVSRLDSWKWTEYTIESLDEVADFAVKERLQYTITGIKSVWTPEPRAFLDNPLRSAHEALLTYADTKQPVTLFTPVWTDPAVVIEKVDATYDVSSGEVLELTITLGSFQIATYTIAEIPESILAAELADTAGGEATEGSSVGGATEADEREKTFALQTFEYLTQ